MKINSNKKFWYNKNITSGIIPQYNKYLVLPKLNRTVTNTKNIYYSEVLMIYWRERESLCV